jgi:hypothetical protein
MSISWLGKIFCKKIQSKKTSNLEKTDPELNLSNFWWRVEVWISVPNIATNTFFIMHPIMLDKKYLNSPYDSRLQDTCTVQLWDTCMHYEIIIIVSLFMRLIFF